MAFAHGRNAAQRSAAQQAASSRCLPLILRFGARPLSLSQGEFDQAGQRVTPVSASQSVRDMDDARQKQGEQPEKGKRGDAAVPDTGADSDAVAQAQKRRQTAPPRPLDDRRPGGEKSDPAAPWSE